MTRLRLVIGVLTSLIVSVSAQSPDLIAVKPANPVINTQTFADGDCNIVEGAVPAAGTYRVLWFDTATENLGNADLVIGDPTTRPDLFEFSTCHGHYHIHGYARYALWTPNGYKTWLAGRDLTKTASDPVNATLLTNATATGEMVSAHKQGFCMMDSYCGHVDEAGPSTTQLFGGNTCWDGNGWSRSRAGKFTCQNQGLTVGWGDIYKGWFEKYNDGLDGQFIVLSGPGVPTVVPGKYILELWVNPEFLLPDSNTSNNVATLGVTVK